MNPNWNRLIAGDLNPLLTAARHIDPTRPSELQSLRAHGTTEQVSMILSLLEARRRAEGRLEDQRGDEHSQGNMHPYDLRWNPAKSTSVSD